jgi:RNA polymerase sigma factor (sigma-70 family)
MKIADPGPEVVTAATNGDLSAIDTLLLAIQPAIFNLGVRMLGNREDAADATQEILLKVVTHLGSFRGEAAFTTWVFQIARNQLLTAATRSRETPEVSLESIGGRLEAGLEFSATLGDPQGTERSLTPEDKLAARQVALGCTQNMLMTLDRVQRLAYVLDVVFGLSSDDAADLLDIKPAAYRQRLSRARAALDPFVQGKCGLVNQQAACRCERQLPALGHVRAQAGAKMPVPLAAVHRKEREQLEQSLTALVRMSNAAAVFRAHPDYQAPEAMILAIRSILKAEGYWNDTRSLQ